MRVINYRRGREQIPEILLQRLRHVQPPYILQESCRKQIFVNASRRSVSFPIDYIFVKKKIDNNCMFKLCDYEPVGSLKCTGKGCGRPFS